VPYVCSRCDRRFDELIERCPHDGRRVVRDLSGQTVGGRYRLKDLVGIGGMGSSVWSAWQTSTQRQVAVKLLPATTDSAAVRFTRGAHIASNLSHPNITVVHDYGKTVVGDLYLVMELMEGMNLFRASRRERFQLARVVHMMDMVLRALGHAHGRSVVHRDIKLSNLFWSPTEDDPDFVKVLDFGIARQFDAPQTRAFDSDEVEVTAANQLCGTPQYMAPEQIGFDGVDGRTDLYAVGIATFHLLTGQFPFQGTAHDLFRHHLQTPPPDLQELSDLEVPDSLARWVSRALEKSPDDRFQSAEEMRDALGRIDLNPTMPLVTSSSSAFPLVDFDEPLSGIATPPPSGTAGEVREPILEPKSATQGVLLTLGVVALAIVLIANWPGGSSPRVATDSGPRLTERLKETPSTVTPLVNKETRRSDSGLGSRDKASPAITPAKVIETARNRPIEIRVITNPSGAKVYQDDEKVGSTPLDLRLTPGTHLIRLERSGFVTQIERVVIDAEQDSSEKKVRRISLKKIVRSKRRRVPSRSKTRSRKKSERPVSGSTVPSVTPEIPTDKKEVSTDQSKRVKVGPLDSRPQREPEIEVLD